MNSAFVIPFLAFVFPLLLIRAQSAYAQDTPDPVKTDLFMAGVNGYGLYRIPGLVVTSKGTVLVYCEARKSGKTDWGHIDVVIRRSTDGGKTFAPMKKLVELEGKFERNPAAAAQNLGKEGEITVNNPVAFADMRTGDVHFLYCVEYNRLFSMRSEDDGESFSKPVEITDAVAKLKPSYDWQSMAVGPGHGLCLQNGRLIVPIWLSTGKGGHAHRPSVVSTIFSDDEGQTWVLGEIVANETKPLVNPSESVLLEQLDGRVQINIRSESPEHRRAVASSATGSSRWTEPRFHSELLEPVCMASIIRWTSSNEADKNRIVFANPHNLERAGAKSGQGRDRKNLSLKISYDEGATWPVNRTLEAGPSAYSDLAIAGDGSLLCFYERTLTDETTKQKAAYLTLARVTLPWLTDGKDKLPTK